LPNLDDFVPFDPSARRQADKTRYPGAHVDVLYDRRRCMHAAECGRAAAGVFNARRSPWISPDAAAADAVTAVIHRCPTGALQAVRDDAIVPPPLPETNEVVVSPEGPLYLSGRILVEDEDGGSDDMQHRVALCRCGASRNKPYCDSSHGKIRFRDAGGVASDAAAAQREPGDVKVKAIPDGPLMVSGPMTLRAASGRIAATKSRLFLCRCGNSKNKPYCDGAHKTVGFRSVDGDGR